MIAPAALLPIGCLGLLTMNWSAPGAALASALPQFVRIGAVPALPRAAKIVGRVAPTTELALEIVLAPRSAATLARRAEQISDPSSILYHRYLRAGEFARLFGDSAATIGRVESALRREGLAPIAVAPNHLSIEVRAPARVVERALATGVVRVEVPGAAGRAVLNTDAPRIPRSIAHAVQAVLGLDTLPGVAHSGLVRTQGRDLVGHREIASAGPAPSQSCLGAVDDAGFSADQIAAAYGLSGLYANGDLGAGVSVGLIEFTPFIESDIAEYVACYGLDYPNISTVLVGSGPVVTSPANEVEAELDLEDLIGLVPDAKFIIYEGTDFNGDVSTGSAYDTFETAINSDQVAVLSTSWGTCEEAVGDGVETAENVLFEQAALQGQTVVAAAGDQGSEDCYGTLTGSGGDQLAVDDPASQPYVTGVGGTTLQIGASNSESVWNTTLAQHTPGAGGGGVSAIWPMPGYQSDAAPALKVVTTESKCPDPLTPTSPSTTTSTTLPGKSTSGNCRELPDVSANAGSPYAIYCTLPGINGCNAGGWTGLDGTSAAAPTWAAIFALADADPACATSGAVGFANPALYAIAGRDYSGAFTDITLGDNDLTGTHSGHYLAHRGYDLASGLGSPIASNATGTGLVAELCATPRASAASGLPAPTIASVRPAVIRARAGVHVTITGTNFVGATAVHFGGRRAISFRLLSPTTIAAVAPTGAGPVHVTVTTKAGTSTKVRPDVFDYLVAPLLFRVSPPSTTTGGGTVVLIGRHFRGTRQVLFGTVPAASFRVQSASRIIAVAPPGHGTVLVRVRTRGGVTVAGVRDRFRYRPAG